MLLTFMAQNLSHGGLRNDTGEAEDRVPLLLERFKSVAPSIDILLLSEAEDWDKAGHRYLGLAMQELDMDSVPLSKPSTGFPVALLYRKETVGRWQNWDTKFSDETTHGFGVAAFDIGLATPLSVISAHINPFSKEKALSEIGLIASRGYRNGSFAIIGGDINFPPNDGVEPDYSSSSMRPYNAMSRTEFNDPGNDIAPKADRRMAQTLERAGYVDVAHYLHKKDSDDSLLQKTAGEYRIDQFWVSEPLASAIIKYWVVDSPATASDHKGIVFQLDTDLIDNTNPWSYR
jgi:endonuclease/exonuclease/phosphatase family metal-dependent hydrolase